MSAPTFGSIGTKLGASGSTPAFAVPAGVGAGDIIVVAFYAQTSTTTITAFPSGFTEAENSPRTVNAGGTGNHCIHVAWKRATGNDTGTYQFTLSAAVFVYGNAVRYTGCVASGNPWDSPTSTADGGNSILTTAPAVSVTTAGADRMLFYVASDESGDGGTWTQPAGMNQRQGGTNATNCEIADLVQTAAGSSGSLSATITAGGADRMGAWLGALIGTTSSGTTHNADSTASTTAALTSTAVKTAEAATAAATTATLTSTAAKTTAAASTASTTAALGSTGVVTAQASASLATTAGLTSIAVVTAQASAVLTTTAALTSTADAGSGSLATLATTAALTAAGVHTAVATAPPTTTALLAATGAVTASRTAALATTAALTAAAVVSGQVVRATSSGTVTAGRTSAVALTVRSTSEAAVAAKRTSSGGVT